MNRVFPICDRAVADVRADCACTTDHDKRHWQQRSRGWRAPSHKIPFNFAQQALRSRSPLSRWSAPRGASGFGEGWTRFPSTKRPRTKKNRMASGH